MNKKNIEISSWIFPVLLYFIYPEVGGIFLLLKIFFTVLKGLKKSSLLNRDSSFEEIDSISKNLEPHEIDFSHDHTYNKSKRKNTNTFETEIHVRCPICHANNFVNQIPTECEYCGNQIVKV